MVHIQSVDHVVLTVADVEAAARWYHDVLGTEVLRLDEWRRGEVPFASLRLTPTSLIDLLEGERSGVNVDHVAITVDPCDLEVFAREHGLDVEMGPASLFGAQGQGWGIYVRDIDGNRVEIRHYGRSAHG
jgi:glyoxylase I family protein